MSERKKKELCLSGLCLLNIIENIDFWNQQVLKYRIYCGDYSSLGPFDNIPPSLLKELVNELNDVASNGRGPSEVRHQLCLSGLELLLSPNVEVLEFQHYRHLKESDITRLLDLVGRRCTQLKYLQIDHFCGKIPTNKLLGSLLPNLSKLQSLNANNTLCGDEGLLLLAKHCQDLRILIVSTCPVSDTGIEALCGISNNYAEADSIKGCKLISKLDILHTNVSARGVELILLHFPDLTSLVHKMVVPTLDKIYQESLRRNKDDPFPDIDRHKYSLTDLYYYHTDENFAVGSLIRAMQLLCLTSLTQLAFGIHPQMMDEDILPLAGMRHLRKLSLFSCSSSFGLPAVGIRVTFNGGIQPVLRAIGQTLEKLEVKDLSVNLNIIARLCPNVKEVNLCAIRACSAFSLVSSHPPKALMLRLETLSIDQTHCKDIIPSDGYDALFSSPALTTMYIHFCSDLDDGVFQRANSRHGFRNLEDVRLVGCHRLTRQVIDILFNIQPPVSKIALLQCSLFTVAEAKALKIKLQEEKRKTFFQFSPA